MIARRRDWPSRLSAYLAAARGRPWRRGRFDCWLFMAGAVRAMTGRDLARGFRGYRSRAEGIRRLEARGYADPVEILLEHFAEIPPDQAGPGDLVLFGDVPALVTGPRAYAVSEANGLGLVELAGATRAFRI